MDVHGCLAEINRVLKMGGLLILTVPYHGLIKNLGIALLYFERHYNPYISHVRFYTKKSLKACLLRGGFKVVRWEGLGRYWPIWMSVFVIAEKTSLPEPRPEIIG
jgi:2-polyprenyl-6-hydroxyphenyl methylase/3-demethylubiquinone-9 3-methyltransferase